MFPKICEVYKTRRPRSVFGTRISKPIRRGTEKLNRQVKEKRETVV